MNDKQTSIRKQANVKIKELAKKADICLFTTTLTKLPLTTRSMSTREVDDDGCLWFFSRKDSKIKTGRLLKITVCNYFIPIFPIRSL